MTLQKVYFQPWVGIDYRTLDKKLLILGESHYGPKDSAQNFTIILTEDYTQNKWSHRFWTNIMQLIEGRSYWEIDREAFWAKVALYNYIQEPLPDAGIAPPDEMFERAKEPFFEVLNYLKPTHILILSKRLWDNMVFNESDDGGKLKLKGEEREMWNYPYKGGLAKATWLPHPSRVSAQDWHPWVLEFLKK